MDVTVHDVLLRLVPLYWNLLTWEDLFKALSAYTYKQVKEFISVITSKIDYLRTV